MSDKPVPITDHRSKQCIFEAALIHQSGKKLGTTGVALYCALLTYAPNPCPSQANLADLYGISVPTVRKYLAKLEDTGWIRIEQNFDPITKTYDVNRYHILDRHGGVVKPFYQGGKTILQESSPSLLDYPVIETLAMYWNDKINPARSNQYEMFQAWEERFGLPMSKRVIDHILTCKTAEQLKSLPPSYFLVIAERWESDGEPSNGHRKADIPYDPLDALKETEDE